MLLVTGGAGYIGSHTVHQLKASGVPVIVLDNLYSGFKWAVPDGVKLFEGNMGNQALVKKIISENKVDSVIHFAAHLAVEESMKDPIKYYRNNFINSTNFVEICCDMGVKNFIFSSTCSAYGTPSKIRVDESEPLNPISPYGKSKLMTEWMIQDMASVSSLKFVILRYFNVAGAKVGGGLGQATPQATQLVKVAAEVATGKRQKLSLYGTQYNTPDGTCIRDYIHVDDLANAHLLALEYLQKGGKSEIFNCGYGKGYSVKEVISAMKKVSNVDFVVDECPPRDGDVVSIFANSEKIRRVLDWQPKFDNIELICKTSYEWELATALK